MYLCNVKKNKSYQLKKGEMKKQKDELEEINFQIFRIKHLIRSRIGADP